MNSAPVTGLPRKVPEQHRCKLCERTFKTLDAAHRHVLTKHQGKVKDDR